MNRKPVAVALVVFLLQGSVGAYAQSVLPLTWLEGQSDAPVVEQIRGGPSGGGFSQSAPPAFHPAPSAPRPAPSFPRSAPSRPAPSFPRSQPRSPSFPRQQPRAPHAPSQPRVPAPHQQPQPRHEPRQPEPPTRNPRQPVPPTHDPRRPEPPHQQPRPLPPVAHHPNDGGSRTMPKARPLPAGHVMDPRRHGADIPHPDGAPEGGHVWADAHGRQLAPGDAHVALLNRYPARSVVRNWNRNDHGYHWSDWNGARICHYYDARGFHWFGWYVGSAFFWTRYYESLYWWYDPYFHRWCYERDGRWWWQDPDNVALVYIYSGGMYYRYEPGTGGVVLIPDPTAPVDAPPAGDQPAPPTDPNAKVYCSQDGSRCVDVSGANSDAYLRDTADPPAFQPVYLDSGVTDVRFRLDDDGQLQQVLLLKGDGGFSVFDQDGQPQDPVQQMSAPGLGRALRIDTLIDKSPTFQLLRGLGVE